MAWFHGKSAALPDTAAEAVAGQILRQSLPAWIDEISEIRQESNWIGKSRGVH
jgi:hypothetical protein